MRNKAVIYIPVIKPKNNINKNLVFLKELIDSIVFSYTPREIAITDPEIPGSNAHIPMIIPFKKIFIKNHQYIIFFFNL